MRYAAVLLIISALATAGNAAKNQDRTEVFLTLEEAPKSVFPEADGFRRRDVASGPKVQRKLQELIGSARPSIWEPFYITFEALREGKVIGYAVICEEIGKHRPITFIVGAGLDGAVRDVSIMMYRESIGGEVRYPGFLKQFHNKSLADPITHRRDVKNITGATLSARSMSRGVRKALAVLQITYIKPETAAKAATE